MDDEKNRRWLLLALFSVGAVLCGETFMQIVFVPNWIAGDVLQNLHHYRNFMTVTHPGMYFVPPMVGVFGSHIFLLVRSPGLPAEAKSRVAQSLLLMVVVMLLTIFVISKINRPILDEGLGSPEDIRSQLVLWAGINGLRMILPGIAMCRLASLLRWCPKYDP